MQSRNKTRRSFLETLEGRRLLSASAADVIVSPNLTLDTAAATTTTPHGYSPAQIKKAYGFDSISFNGVTGDGTGQTIAIVDAYNDPTIASDLAKFSSTFGLPQASLSVVSQTGSKSALPKNDAGWSSEIALDVEWAHAIAPGAKILLVEAKSDSLNDLMAAVDYARSAAGVSVVSMSWGTSEFRTETSYDSHFTTPTGHAGVTFVAASGDEGSWYGPDYPASSPNVLSVGGTTLSLDSSGNVLSETPWQDSTGGTSSYEYAASYQSAASNALGRSSPDVSYDANPSTGFAVYDMAGSGGWVSVGGTSAGAPQWAALVAIADQGRAINGLGSLDGASATLPALYAAYSNGSYTTDFTDITSTVYQRTFGFHRWRSFSSGVTAITVDAGYDTTTGLGTPEAAGLVSSLLGVQTSTTVVKATRLAKVKSAKRISRMEDVLDTSNQSVLSLPPVSQPSLVPQLIAAMMHANDSTAVIAPLPKTTFVLQPLENAQGAIADSTHVFSDTLTISPQEGAPVVTDTPVAQLEPALVQTVTTEANPATAAPSLAVATETTFAHAAAFATSVVVDMTDADGWMAPIAAAGTVLLMSWTIEQAAARRRALSPDAGRAGLFNFIEPVVDPRM